MNCGAPLAPAGVGQALWDSGRAKDADRTKTGVFLLLLGTLLGWVPYLIVSVIAFLVVIVGASLILAGRRSFGRAHARYTVVALLLVIFGIVGSIAFSVGFLLALNSIPPGSSLPTVIALLASAFNNYVLGLILVAAVSGLASVLFTYALQRQAGKTVLWAGYGATLGLNIAIFLLISPVVGPTLVAATAGGSFDPAPLQVLLDEIVTLSFLGVVPAALFAAADFLAWSRINRGEIPVRGEPPEGSGPIPSGGAAPPMPP